MSSPTIKKVHSTNNLSTKRSSDPPGTPPGSGNLNLNLTHLSAKTSPKQTKRLSDNSSRSKRRPSFSSKSGDHKDAGGKEDGANSGRILKIYLPKGQVHSTLIRPERTVKDVLEKLCELREDLNLEKYIPKDMSGTEIDLTKTLGEIGLTEFSFNAKRDGSPETILPALKGSGSNPTIPTLLSLDTLGSLTRAGILLDSSEVTPSPRRSDQRKRLSDIVARMRHKTSGVSIKNRRVKLRLFNKCFVAAELVKWIEENLKNTKPEAIALGRELEKEGFISHVTLSHNFDDDGQLFRFAEDEIRDYKKIQRGSGEHAMKLNLNNLKKIEEDEAASSLSPKPDQAFSYSAFWVDQQDPNMSDKRPDLQQTMLIQALSSYVPKLVLRRFIRKHVALEPPENEQYHACVLFADISGFTPLAEKLAKLGSRGVEQLTAYLNEYFGQMINLIHNHGGDIVKFAGDALLAIWPTDNEQNLRYAIMLATQCSLAMQEHLHEFKADECTLTLHVGIGAGMVSGIHVGVPDHTEFFIAGDPLEQVAECEHTAQPGEVYISNQAAKAIADSIQVSVDAKDQPKGGRGPPKKKMLSKLDDSTCFRLEKVTNPVELPPTLPLPHAEQTKNMISPYVQPAVLGHLSSGSPEHFLAELRSISVIFVNIGLTFSTEAIPKIQEAMKAMQSAVYHYEGTVRQFIVDDKGSVFIAAFGLPPLSHEDDPSRAVKTALLIQKKLQQIEIKSSIGVTTGKAFCGAVGSEERREYAMVGDIVNLSARLMAKAGGGVLVDNPTYTASKNQLRFNTLAPIMVKGKNMPIEIYSPVKEAEKRNVSGRTTTLRGSLRFTKRKGITPRSGRSLSNMGRLDRSNMPIFGRVEEMKLLNKEVEWLVRVEREKENSKEEDNEDTIEDPHVILIEGQAGIGKTRLLQEFLNTANDKKIKSVVGSGLAIEASTPYYAWHEIFTVILNAEDMFLLTPQEKAQQINKTLDELGISDVSELAPLLNPVLGWDLPENDKTEQMSGQVKAENLQVLLLRLLQASDFTMFTLENAQWLDSQSWSLTLAAAQTLKGSLFLLAYRPFETAPPLDFEKIGKLPTAKKITLKNLDSESIKAIAAHRLGCKTLPVDIAQQVIERGGGEPLLSIELIDALRASGRFEVSPQGEIIMNRKLVRSDSTVFPSNLRALITSKVDRLPQSQQMILKVAAVIGRAFPFDLLKDIMPAYTTKADVQSIKADLEQLDSLDFISLRSEKPLTYLFKQIMMQEVIYAQMLYAQRRQVHEKVAEWYVNSKQDQTPSYNLLAHHYKQAERWDLAVVYLAKAGEHALDSFANREAVNFLNEAIELKNKAKPAVQATDSAVSRPSKTKVLGEENKNQDDPEVWTLIRWQRQLGQAFYNQGLMDKASEHLETALNLMNKPLKTTTAQQLLSKLKSVSTPHIDPKGLKSVSSKGDLTTAAPENVKDKKKSSKRIRTLVQVSEEVKEYILILLGMGKVNYYACNKNVITYCNLMALKQAEEIGISKALCEAYGNCILTLSIHKKNQLAENFIDMGMFFSKQYSTTDSAPLANVLQMTGMYHSGVCNWEKAIDAFKQAIELGNNLGDCRLVEECTYFQSTCLFLQGKINDCLELMDDAVESARKRGDTQSFVLGLTTLARTRLALGQPDKAMSILQEIEGLIGQNRDYRLDMASEINFHGLMALCYLYKRDFEMAVRTADTVVALLDKCEPTAYFTFPGYFAPAEVYLTFMLEMQKNRPTSGPNADTARRLSPSKMSLKIGKAITHLAKFAEIFPFMEPRLLSLQGLQELVQGRQDRAIKQWERSVQAAIKLGMLYEEALAHYRLGKTSASMKENVNVVQERLQHYDRAVDIFSIIGAVYTELLLD